MTINLNKFEELVTFRQEDEDGNITLDHGDILELIDMARQAEKDAARYRWLRDRACTYDLGEFYNTLKHNRDSLMDDLMNA